MTELIWALPGSRGVEKAAKKKTRALSYTGCWTCRDRKVKCDERPTACYNCERAGRVCAGYGVRLVWRSNGNRDASSRPSQRRRVLSQHDWSVTEPGINGPRRRPRPTHRDVQGFTSAFVPIAFAPDRSPQLTHQDPRDRVVEITSQDDVQILDPPHAAAISHDTDHVSPPDRDEYDLAAQEDEDDETSVPLSSARHPVRRRCEEHSNQLDLGIGIAMETWISPTLSERPSGAVLLQHYTNAMVCLMQPVSHQSNPFKTIYLSTALDACQEVEPLQLSPAAASVYHSILATAATHLQGLAWGSTQGMDRLSLYHRSEALKAMQDTLNGRRWSYKIVMTAILSLVSVDVLEGGTNDHWTHLEAAWKLLETRRRFRQLSKESRQLNTMCTMLRLFAQTSQAISEPLPWPAPGLSEGMYDLSYLEACIEFVYGITPALARAIYRIFTLSRYLAYYEGAEPPESLVVACEDLGDDILSWNIKSEPFSTISDSDEMVGVATAQATAFHQAALIYYLRSIQKCSRHELHAEQRATFEAMSLAEDLKARSPHPHGRAAPISWPAFIASCEAVGAERRLWAQWWERVQSYRMANYSKQRAVVEEIWKRIDDNLDGRDWRDVLAEMNVRILPV